MIILSVKDSEIFNIAYTTPEGNPEEGYDSETGIYFIYKLLEDFGNSSFKEFMDTHYWNGFELLSRPTRPGEFALWDMTTTSWIVDQTLLLDRIRAARNGLLTASDWTQLSDVALTETKKIEWATYRQQLRDFPESIQLIYFTLESVPWPTPPT